MGVRSRIGRNVVLRDTVLIGADRFETDPERAANRQRGVPDIGIGDNSVIEKAIVDKDCRIGRNVHITITAAWWTARATTGSSARGSSPSRAARLCRMVR